MTNKKQSSKKLSLNHFKVNSISDATKLIGGATDDGPDTTPPKGSKPRHILK